MKEHNYIIAWIMFVLAFIIACVILGGGAGLFVALALNDKASHQQIMALSNVAGAFMAFPASYVAFRVVVGIVVKRVRDDKPPITVPGAL